VRVVVIETQVLVRSVFVKKIQRCAAVGACTGDDSETVTTKTGSNLTDKVTRRQGIVRAISTNSEGYQRTKPTYRILKGSPSRVGRIGKKGSVKEKEGSLIM